MKFKYSAFTENTAEMREWLEKLGYEPYNIPPFGVIIDRMPDADILYTSTNGKFNVTYAEDKENIWDLECDADCIDCRNNLALFQAVTAMRDDSDYMQWFVIDYFNEAIQEYKLVWRLCGDQKMDEDSLPYVNILLCHKATIEELIAHFKINK